MTSVTRSHKPRKFHPVLVSLHWLMAILILLGLFFGKFLLETTSNDDPLKLQGLTGHMTIGIIIGALLVLRLFVRVFSTLPARATTGHRLLDWAAAATHWAFYLLVGMMVLSGIAMAFQNNLFSIVFGGSGEALPAYFSGPPRSLHGIVSTLLAALIALHVAAALYHQLYLRDRLLSRMWFGKRRDEAPSDS